MPILNYALTAVQTCGFVYLIFLGLLTTSWFQAHVVYLHAVQMTWGKNLDVPEIFGFLHNQVTPFNIRSQSGQQLYAWHILPVDSYRQHEQTLLSEPAGLALDFANRHALSLLRDDPESRLVIHFHGAGGTVGSGYRCPNYRALSAGQLRNTHVLTFDYRGFGRSPGSPTESGLIADALSVVDWAMNVAQIPPSRILIYSQSLGTAVNMAVAEHYAAQKSPIVFAGHILTAPFVDVPTLVSTYKIAGTIPILGPLARIPPLFNYLLSLIKDKWSTKDRIAAYVKSAEASGEKYKITILHAEDDYDIPWTHTPQLFWHAVNASTATGIGFRELEQLKAKTKVDLGPAGTVMEWKSDHGIIREEILKHGLHDVIMGNPIVSLAVARIFA